MQQGLGRPTKREGFVTNARGQRLYTTSFVPVKGPPLAVVCFHHGLGELGAEGRACTRFLSVKP